MSRLFRIIGAVTLINIFARVFSFVREIVIAGQYGTSYQADAIISAYTLPNFFYLVIGGAFTTAFISIYHSKNYDKQRYSRTVFTLLTIVSGLVVIGSLLFAQDLMRVMVNEDIEASVQLTTILFYWMMPSTIFLILSTFISGILNVHDEFKSSSVGVLLYNLLFLIIAVVLSLVYGPIGYGIGALFAAVGMFIYLWREMKRTTPIRLSLSYHKQTGAKEVWLLALPILFGGATMQFYFVIHRVVSAQLGEGAISSVNYASKLTSFPQAILMTAVTTVIYPLLSKKLKENQEQEVHRLFRKGLLMIFALILPATLVAYWLAEPIIQLIYGYGKFKALSIAQTVPLFQVFAGSMFFLAANTFITRFYYAQGNSIAPVLFSLITVFGINLGVIWMLIETQGAVAIAYGTLISAAINFVLLYLYYHWKYHRKSVLEQ